MKLPPNSIISPEKLTQYLLVLRKRNDKSRWLAQAGYTHKNWQLLEKDIRTQILLHEATSTKSTPYGEMHEIKGELTGPNGKTLDICTIWMTEVASKKTKFITLYPDKGDKR